MTAEDELNVIAHVYMHACCKGTFIYPLISRRVRPHLDVFCYDMVCRAASVIHL